MAVMIEARSYRPFKSSEEYLYAMKEDLAEWLSTLYPELMINVDNFMDRLDTGVALCKHANNVRVSAIDHESRRVARGLSARTPTLPAVPFLPAARAATFFARDNVSNFIAWCRRALGIIECLLFETDDLIMRKNEKHVILCLLEVARKGSKFGMLAPMLVQMERQIDREILLEARRCGGVGVPGDSEEDEDDVVVESPPMVYGPVPQIITNDLKSLDEMVRELVERCNCPTQFPMIRVSEGKYRIGDTKVLIFVRVLRSHVMVRVGGGWDTLSHYLDKHDPCRCRAQHRTTHAARVIQRYPMAAGIDLAGAEVHYDRSPPRTRRSSVSSVGSSGGGSPQHAAHLGAPQHTAARQRSRSPAPRPPADRSFNSLPYMGNNSINAFENQAFNHLSADTAYQQSKYSRRSVSPSPARRTSRAVSPAPVRKTSYSAVNNFAHTQNFTSPALVASPNLIPNPHRNNRSRSPTPRAGVLSALNITSNGTENRRLVITPEKETPGNTNGGLFDTPVYPITEVTTIDGVAIGSENASDNGSEVSDEGYRSLGVIQNGSAQTSPPGLTANLSRDVVDKGIGLKLNRLSLNSQASTDDADISERPECLPASETTFKRQTSSSDCSSQMSTTEDRSRGSEEGTTITNYSDTTLTDRFRKVPREEVSSVTGLRKTNYSETLYGDKKTPVSTMERKHVRNSSSPPICMDRNDSPSYSLQKAATSTKIPQSPVLNRRRMSMENLSPGSRSRSGSRDRSFVRNRSVSRDASSPVKKPSPGAKYTKDSASKPPVPANSPTGVNSGSLGKVTGGKVSSSAHNTWNGRTPVVKGKARPSITSDTFNSPNRNQNIANKVSSPPFQRNTNLRASATGIRSMAGYDHNGRRIRTSPNSSPIKTVNKQVSPLRETIFKSTEQAKDDLAVLEGLKDIVRKFSALVPESEKRNDGSKLNNEDGDFSDFTSAWVHSNGTLERSQSSRQLRDSLNNCTAAPTSEGGSTTSVDNGSGLKSAALVSKIPMFSPRRDSKAGVTSRIPAPVSATGFRKGSDYFD